jgi:hypothetical protein
MANVNPVTPWQQLLRRLGGCVRHLDVETWGIRWAFAEAVGRGSSIPVELGITVAQPSADDGNRIHDKLQGRFVEYHGPASARGHDVVVERTAYLRPDIEVPLEAAVRHRPGQTIFPFLGQAFKTRGPQRIGNLRTDLADATTMEIWEIKPIGSLGDAVVQLAGYVARYNCLAQIPLTRYRGAFRPLTPGTSLDLRVLLPFTLPLDGQDEHARLVVPFELVPLPGIIGYVILRLPTPGQVVTVAVADALRRLLRELRRRRWRVNEPSSPPGIPEWLFYVPLAVGVALAAAGAVAAAPEEAAAGGVYVSIRTASALLSAAGVTLSGPAFAAPPAGPTQPGRAASRQDPVPLPPATLRTAFGSVSADTAEEAVAVLWLLAALFAAIPPPD